MSTVGVEGNCLHSGSQPVVFFCLVVGHHDAFASLWITLPGHHSTNSVQTGSNGSPVLTRQASQYLIDCCTLMLDIAGRQRLWSAVRHQLNVPWHCCSRFGRRAFSIAGPRAWNLLPDHLRDPSLSSGSFRSALKTYLFTTHRNT